MYNTLDFSCRKHLISRLELYGCVKTSSWSFSVEQLECKVIRTLEHCSIGERFNVSAAPSPKR